MIYETCNEQRRVVFCQILYKEDARDGVEGQERQRKGQTRGLFPRITYLGLVFPQSNLVDVRLRSKT